MPRPWRFLAAAILLAAVGHGGDEGPAMRGQVEVRGGDLRLVLADNQAYGEAHRAGYNGVSELEHATRPTSDARIWIGRHAEFAEFLRSAPVDRLEDVGSGVTGSQRAFFRPGGLAESAVVKVLPPGFRGAFFESYKSEVAAYELDRILGLEMVPVTVERRIGDHLASVQLWANGRLLSKIEKQAPSHPGEWSRQVRRYRVFDALIANIDRNAQNIIIDNDWNIILIDHSRAFAVDTMPNDKQITRIDRELFAAIKALDEKTLTERLRPWLFDDGALRKILRRRDKIVANLERLIQERGEAAVLSH